MDQQETQRDMMVRSSIDILMRELGKTPERKERALIAMGNFSSEDIEKFAGPEIRGEVLGAINRKIDDAILAALKARAA